MSKALDAINIVEFDSNLGAAYATMLLAENGARAIKVEPPGGSRDRGTPHFHVLNRSKRALQLDLDDRASQARVAELIRWADIVVTGFTPSRLKQLRLDAESIHRINPRAIALGVPPLGSRGPDADFDANDDLVAARGGITGSQWARSGNPVALVFPASSYSAGVMAATAAVAAILARGANGAGQAVEVSLLAGAFSLHTGGILRHEKMTALYHGPQDPLGPIPVYRLFEAADGKYLFAACGNSTFWGKFAIAIDRPDLVGDPRFENAPWGIAGEHWQPLKDIIEPIIRTRPRDQWLSILREADVPCAPVMTRQEFIDHPQTRALDMRKEIDDPTLGRMIQMGLPVFLNDTPGEITGAAPENGDERAALQWLREPTRDSSQKTDLRVTEKPPLDGVTVLDFASYIAGSYGPMILAQLGAKVIKIESLEGDSFRHFGFGFLGWNQGKRGISLNLASAEGREIIHGARRQSRHRGRESQAGPDAQVRLRLRGARRPQPAHHLYVGQRVRKSRARTQSARLRSAAAGALGRDGGAGRPSRASGVSHLRDLRLRRRDALRAWMRPRAARTRTDRTRAILRDLAAAIRDGVPGRRVRLLCGPPRHGKWQPRESRPLRNLTRVQLPRRRMAIHLTIQ